MKKGLLILLLTALTYIQALAQTGIGTTTPHADAALEINSTNKGVLIPRLALESTTSSSPLSAHVAGMLVYNTATSGTAPTNVNPGTYFNDGTKWVRVANAADGDKTDDAWINDYSNDGNTANDVVKLGTKSDGTSARATNTDVVVTDNGRLGLGTPGPTAKLHVKQGDFRLENQDNWNAYKGVSYSSGPEGEGNKHYPQLFLFYAKGTKAAPKYPLSYNTLGVFRSANAVDSAGGSGFRVRATNNHSAGSYGSAVVIFTNPNGTSSNIDRFIVDHNGNVGIHHNVGDIILGNALKSRLSVGGYVQLGSADVTADAAATTASQRTGMIRYNSTSKTLQYHDDTQWQTAASSSTADLTKDAWINDNTNTQIKLATLSDGTTARSEANDVVIKDTGNMGLGTASPQKKLHVNGALQVTNELNVGGNATTAGSAGTAGQVLTSSGADAAPTWKSINTVSGTIAKAAYIQGTTPATTTSFGIDATPIDVPGVTYTHTVPAGISQTLLFTVTGYAVRSATVDNQAAQGVFTLLQGSTKISSAFASSGEFGDLSNVPVPVTMLKSVTLNSGTYTFKVQYKAWSDNQTVNFKPSTYLGYDGDTEAMLTKMQVLVYNN